MLHMTTSHVFIAVGIAMPSYGPIIHQQLVSSASPSLCPYPSECKAIAVSASSMIDHYIITMAVF
jgi:hypothetical protein